MKTKEQLEQDFLSKSRQPAAIYDRKAKRILDCNAKVQAVFGYESKEEFLGLDLKEYLYPIQFDGLGAEELIQKVFNYFQTQEVLMVSILGLKKNREIIILEMCAFRNYLNEKEETIFFFREIDEAYLTTREVLQKNLIYNKIIDKSFDLIDIHEVVILDSEKFKYKAILLDRSLSMQHILGVGKKPIVSVEEIEKLTPPAFFEKHSSKIENLILHLRQERSIQFEWQFLDKESGTIVEMDVIASLLNIKGKLILVRVMRDISSKVRREKQIEAQNLMLQEKNEKLETYIESNSALKNFAHLASHDMRAPLRTIQSFASILRSQLDTQLSQEQKTLFDFITKGCSDLTNLVNDQLDFSTVSEKALKLKEIDTNVLMNEILHRISKEVEEKEASVHILEMPEKMLADRLKIARVFQNLILNSIKFCAQGERPKIEISGLEETDFWRFSVRDFGLGIKESNQEDIFKMYRKLNGQKFGGSGLGLSLCKKIIDQHNGEITVNSVLGEGSTFTFSISKSPDKTSKSEFNNEIRNLTTE